MTKVQLVVVPYDWMIRDTPDAGSYAAGLPDVSGSFTGTYDQAVLDTMLPDIPVVIPVEVDTHDRPNPLAAAQKGFVITLDLGAGAWRMTVDRIEPLGGNRVRAWVRKDSISRGHDE